MTNEAKGVRPISEADLDRFPDVISRELFRASGEVEDRRRIVQFLFLLLRDHVPVGVLANAHTKTFARDAQGEQHKGFVTSPLASRLVDQPTVWHRMFLVDLGNALYDHFDDDTEDQEYVLDEVLKKTQPTDDTLVFLSNGFLARYCQFIADTLQNGLPSNPVS